MAGPASRRVLQPGWGSGSLWMEAGAGRVQSRGARSDQEPGEVLQKTTAWTAWTAESFSLCLEAWSLRSGSGQDWFLLSPRQVLSQAPPTAGALLTTFGVLWLVEGSPQSLPSFLHHVFPCALAVPKLLLFIRIRSKWTKICPTTSSQP